MSPYLPKNSLIAQALSTQLGNTSNFIRDKENTKEKNNKTTSNDYRSKSKTKKKQHDLQSKE